MSTDLLYTEVEEDLRAAVRGLLADRCGPNDVLAQCASGDPTGRSPDRDLSRGLWSALATDIGVAGLLVPESSGGQGASAREVAVVAEELGRAVAPVPFLSSAVVATSVLLATGASGRGGDGYLRRLAAGEGSAVAAMPLSSGPGGAFPAGFTASDDGRLTGRVTAVANADMAETLLVPAICEGVPQWYVVAATGADIAGEIPLDLTRPLATVALAGARGELLADGEVAEAALVAGFRDGATALAAEQLGLAQWCLDETVRYVRERYQFGRPVGSFQALKHRLADVYLDLVTARAAARYAAAQLAAGSGEETDVAVSLAAAHCSRVAVHAAEECVQMHGGIGMTWEHPAHLYLARAKSGELAFGTPDAHAARLARLVGLSPA